MLGNYLDLIIIFYLLICLIYGLRRRLKDTVSDLLGLMAAFILSFYTYKITAQLLENNFRISEAYANIIGFFINISVFKIIIIFALDGIFKKIGDELRLGNPFVKKILSGILSVIYGLLKVIVMLSIAIALFLPVFMTREIDDSRFYNFAQSDPLRINGNFQNIFGQFFQTVLKDLNFLSIKTGSDEKADLGFETLKVSVDSTDEEKMLELVNKERTSRGLRALKMDEEAQKAARDYGKYLFKNGIFSHVDLDGKSPADRMKNYNVTFLMEGENLAYAPGLEQAHQGLMNSPGHKANILNPFFSRVGIGVIDGGPYEMIFVQEFMD
jgi:uncharacterized protein YkwD